MDSERSTLGAFPRNLPRKQPLEVGAMADYFRDFRGLKTLIVDGKISVSQRSLFLAPNLNSC